MKLTARKKNLFHSKKILVPLLFLGLLFFFFFINSNLFIIKSVEVKMQNINCTDENKTRDQSQLMGENIFTIDQRKVEEKLKDKFLCIKGVLIFKGFPSKVSLEVSGRQVAAILINLSKEEATSSSLLDDIIATPSAQNIEDGDKFLVDAEGVVFSKIDHLGDFAPHLYFLNDEEIILGEKVKAEILKNTLLILEKTKNLGLIISKVKVSGDRLLMVDSKPGIVFNLEGQIDVQLASLQLILQKAKIESNELEFIDLRFDKPIIKIAPGKD